MKSKKKPKNPSVFNQRENDMKWYAARSIEEKHTFLYELVKQLFIEIEQIRTDLDEMERDSEILDAINGLKEVQEENFNEIKQSTRILNFLKNRTDKNKSLLKDINSGTNLSNRFIDILSQVFQEEIENVLKEEEEKE